jgi:hypothetical protein
MPYDPTTIAMYSVKPKTEEVKTKKDILETYVPLRKAMEHNLQTYVPQVFAMEHNLMTYVPLVFVMGDNPQDTAWTSLGPCSIIVHQASCLDGHECHSVISVAPSSIEALLNLSFSKYIIYLFIKLIYS